MKIIQEHKIRISGSSFIKVFMGHPFGMYGYAVFYKILLQTCVSGNLYYIVINTEDAVSQSR